MKRSVLAVAILGLVLTLGFAIAAISAEAPAQGGLGQNIESKNVIDFPLRLQFKRPAAVAAKTKLVPVNFSHVGHQKVACASCHHTWDGKSAIQGCAISGCHSSTERSDELSYFDAFHNKTSNHSCYGCHSKLNAESQKKMKLAPCYDNICHASSKKK
jgi:hypothetical protein